MQLTRQTDYACRILIYLAALPEGELTQIQQVCDYFDIARNHVSKIVMKLNKLGYVKAYRGKAGGMELGKKPEEINLGDVVRAFETTLNPVNCRQPRCEFSPDCRLKNVFNKGVQQFLAVLNEYTLADLLDKKIRSLVIKSYEA